MLNKIFLLALCLFSSALAKPAEDLVVLADVPQFSQYTNYTAEIYSGYLYLNENKSHHYMFLESQGNPTTDPLIIWLNGGPGCSSLLGLLYENGPFVYPDGTTELMWNDYAWNTNANIMYMESPAFVGFSYCNDPNMPFNDTQTAQDNLDAFLQWRIKFPEYNGHVTYVMGESYGGVYVPFLAWYIDQYNDAQTNATNKVNLAGYMVGNPVTNLWFDNYSDLTFWSQHAGLSQTDQQEIQKYCTPSFFKESVCNDLLNNFNTFLEDINIYDFYRYCYATSTSPNSTYFNYFKSLYKKHYGYYGTYEPDTGRPPCLDDVGGFEFLNNPDVRNGLHIWPNASVYTNHTWYMCANINYTPGANASYFIYPVMLAKGYRIQVYSGDSDGAVPTIGTIGWIEQLVREQNMTTNIPQTPWTLPGLTPYEPQVQGYHRQYENLKFVTVKGVGHMAPQWNRPASYKMFSYFLSNTTLD